MMGRGNRLFFGGHANNSAADYLEPGRGMISLRLRVSAGEENVYMLNSFFYFRIIEEMEMSSMVGIGMVFMVFFLAFGQWGCEQRPEHRAIAQKSDPGYEVIVAAGDSLTAGFGVAEEESYPAQLEKRLQAAGLGYRVINAGASGETSSGLLSRLNWLLTLNPAIVILGTGANDGLRGIDPALTKSNIREIIRLLKGKKIPVILLGMRMVRNLGPEYITAFDRIYPELAKESGVLFMPFFLEGVATDPALNSSDGIHPNSEGYRIVVNNLYPYVLRAIARREKQSHPSK